MEGAPNGSEHGQRTELLLRSAPHRGGLDGGKLASPHSDGVSGAGAHMAFLWTGVRCLREFELLLPSQSARVPGGPGPRRAQWVPASEYQELAGWPEWASASGGLRDCFA